MKKMLIVSNMYPSDNNPEYGIFVKNFVDQIENLNISYDKIVIYKTDSKIRKLLNYLFFTIKVIYKMLRGNYEIVYVHYPSISGIPVNIASIFREYNIYTNVHGTDVLPVSALEQKLLKNTVKLLKKSSKVVVPSEYYKKIIIEDFGVDVSKLYIYPSGGVNTSVFYPLEHFNTKKSSAITFGMVGRIIKTKGWEVFIKALEELELEDLSKRINIVVVGDGPDRAELLSRLSKLKLNIEFEYVPFIEQNKLNLYYNKFDALIFPTYKESLGLVALESMSSGTPVIASDISPLNNYIVHKSNGLLFEKDSSDELKSNLIYFTSCSDETIKKMNRQALNTAQHYSKEEAQKILGNILNEGSI